MTRSTVANACYGIYAYPQNTDYVFNTVNIYGNNSTWTGASYGLYLTSATGTLPNFYNNIFVNQCTTPATSVYASYIGSSSYLNNMNNNDYLSSGTYLGYYNGTNATTLAAWQSASGKDGNAKNVNPIFTSNTDLHIASLTLNNAGFPYSSVNKDIDGQNRSLSQPDIGADEFTPPALDAGIASIDTPSVGWCAGTKPVWVTIKNFGTTTLTSATINWSVNGSNQTSYNWTGSLALNATAQIQLGTYALNGVSSYDFKSWTSSPNGGTDGNISNDSARNLGMISALTGTYTIGGTTPDFNTFQDARTALVTRGVCGPVVFNVRDGSYQAQLDLGVIGGATSVNTVTFQSQSGDSSLVTLKYPSLSSPLNDYVIRMNGTKWVTFKKMTIQRTFANTQGKVIELKGGANNNTFTNCRIFGVNCTNPAVTTPTSTNYAIVYSATDIDFNNTFKNNNIRYGSYGFYWLGTNTTTLETGTLIQGNKLDSQYYMGIYTLYQDAEQLRSNTLTNIIQTSGYGFYIANNYNGQVISKNRIDMPRSGYGMYIASNIGIATGAGNVSNNFVTIGGTAASYGIYMTGNSWQNIYYNNIRVYNSNSASYAFYVPSTTGTYNNLVNNIFANTAANQVIYVGTSAYINTINYNDYYTTGSNLGQWVSTLCYNLSGWQSATGQEGNSKSINPNFASKTDTEFEPAQYDAVGLSILATPASNGEGVNSSAPISGVDVLRVVPSISSRTDER